MFDTGTRKWEKLIDVPYDLHTIALYKNEMALICSEVSLWVIDLNTLETHTIDTIFVDGKSQHPHDLNSVCCDNQGGIWLGTYRTLQENQRNTRKDSIYTYKINTFTACCRSY